MIDIIGVGEGNSNPRHKLGRLSRKLEMGASRSRASRISANTDREIARTISRTAEAPGRFHHARRRPAERHGGISPSHRKARGTRRGREGQTSRRSTPSYFDGPRRREMALFGHGPSLYPQVKVRAAPLFARAGSVKETSCGGSASASPCC